MQPVGKSDRQLVVVVYHYVRDLPQTRFPRLNGMLTSAFRDQVDALIERYEPATLESALEFLKGRYRPTRDLCLFTFDDGLKEHYTDVLPILRSRGVQGLFFVITSCLSGRVAAVQKSQFLMAWMGFEAYREAFISCLTKLAPSTALAVDVAQAGSTYRWDSTEVAVFKYFFNFQLDRTLREDVLKHLFEKHLGNERAFASDLYLSWSQARDLQNEGMVIGGHSHRHPVLARLETDLQWSELSVCARQLRRGLHTQAHWPFSYPYGDFNQATIDIVRQLGFDCSFSIKVGSNNVGHDAFRICRLDANDVSAGIAEPLCQ